MIQQQLWPMEKSTFVRHRSVVSLVLICIGESGCIGRWCAGLVSAASLCVLLWLVLVQHVGRKYRQDNITGSFLAACYKGVSVAQRSTRQACPLLAGWSLLCQLFAQDWPSLLWGWFNNIELLFTYNNCYNCLQRSTEHVNFWQQAPPIWATATEQGLKISTYLWSRCDISWQDTKPISPAYCETVFQKDGSKTMRINMERALIDFQHGFDATIVSFRFGSNIIHKPNPSLDMLCS